MSGKEMAVGASMVLAIFIAVAVVIGTAVHPAVAAAFFAPLAVSLLLCCGLFLAFEQ